MKALRSTALATALLLPGAAMPQPTHDLPPDVLDGFSVTIEEVRANRGAVYDAFAGPEGGPIPRARFVAFELPDALALEQPDRRLLGRLFTVLDGDGDGRLTRSEWDERIDSDLAFADANGDGRITLTELADARETLGLGEALDLIF